ncbi:hypothetical protein F383_26705 [Gossypium arboreum]|uniref:Uncharacterized protein n=1 Tax=Gossypium arboreum TaxID=29729 RepID=A0A0B0PC38_GOSAR|nr:hypothetical protein F383_26705 [Gossypium arboreum]
MPVYSSTSTTY